MVIQRLQSLLLLAASIVMGCFIFISPGAWYAGNEVFTLHMQGIIDASGSCLLSTWYLLAVSIVAALLPFVAIFAYRNLRRQLMLCNVSLLMVVATWGLAFILGVRGIEDVPVSWNWTIMLPVVSIILIIYAQARINKDKRLLESVDRLR